MCEKDIIEGMGIKEPVSVPGLGKMFWRPSYRSSKYTKKVDFLDDSYVPNWITHYSVPLVNNVLESDFQYFSFDLMLDKPFGAGTYNMAIMYINDLLGTTDIQYIANGNRNATLDQLLLPRNLVLALENTLVNLNGESMLCHYSCIRGDDPMLVTIEFVHCKTSKIPQDNLLIAIANTLSLCM